MRYDRYILDKRDILIKLMRSFIMKKITLFVLVAMTLSTWLDAYDSLCSEGKWCQFSHYPTGVEVDLKSQLGHSTVKVVSSAYQDTDNWIRVFVYFTVENTQKFPTTYGWNNKYLKDKHGNMFYPSKGVMSRKLQPHESSDECYVEYAVPKKIDMKNLKWGLYDKKTKTMRYEINIFPKKEQ